MTQRVILIALISVSLSCLCASVQRQDDSLAVREEAVLAAEPVVRAIAEQGPAALFDRQTRIDLGKLDGESPLFALLGAWSKLSVGRIGLVTLEVAARLPWLVVAGLAPAGLYAILAPTWGTLLALLACAWLFALPHWLSASGHATDAATLASAYLVTFAAYLGSLPRSPHPRTFTALCVLAVAIGLAMSRAMLGVLLLLHVHFVLRHRALAQRTDERGLVVMPSALAFSLVAAPVAFVALNPALYGAPSSAIVGAAFAPTDARSFSWWQFMLPALAAAGAWISHAVCRRYAPPRLAMAAQGIVIVLVAAVSFMT